MKLKSALAIGVALSTLATMAVAEEREGRGFFRFPGNWGSIPRISLAFEPATNVLLGGKVASRPAQFLSEVGPRTLSVNGGEVRVCATDDCSSQVGSWSSSVDVQPNAYVQVRVDGPTAPSQVVNAAVTGQGVTASFRATAQGVGGRFTALAQSTVDAQAGEAATSQPSTFTGWVETPVTVQNGEYRICAKSGSCGSFTSASGVLHDGDQIQVRAVAAAKGQGPVTATVRAGGAQLPFTVATAAPSVDDTPDDFSFPPPSGGTLSEPGTWVVSPSAQLNGHTGVDVSVAGGEYRICATSGCTAGEEWRIAPTQNVADGSWVSLRVKPMGFSQTATATLTAGKTTSSFSATSRAKDTTPDAIVASFGSNPSSAEPGATLTAGPVTLSGFDDAPISVQGTGWSYSINGAPYTIEPAVAKAGDKVTVQVVAGALGESRAGSLSVGSQTFAGTVTTRAARSTVDAFAIANVTGAEPTSAVVSASLTPTGAEVPVSFSVTGGEASVAGGAFAASGTIQPGQSLVVRTTSPAAGASKVVKLTVADRTADWTVASRVRDEEPDLIAFTSLKDQIPAESLLSEIRALTGHEGVTVSISGDGGQYRLCSASTCSGGTVGAWTSAATPSVAAGTYVQLRLTAPDLGGTATTTLSYGTRQAAWGVTSTSTPPVVSGVPYSWGYNVNGSLGIGSGTTEIRTATRMVLPSGVNAMSGLVGGSTHGCGFGDDGALYCFGSNGQGENGPIGGASTVPKKVVLPSGVTAFKSHQALSLGNCALDQNDAAWCWGYGNWGQLGNGTKASSATPVKVTFPQGVTSWKSLYAGKQQACAKGSNDVTYCWGDDLPTGSHSTPTAMPLPQGVTGYSQIATGTGFFCAIASDTQTYCLGGNSRGQIGNGTTTDVTVPTKVKMPSGVTSFTKLIGDYSTMFGKGSDGIWYSWGYNQLGTLGNGSTDNGLAPAKLKMPSGVTTLTVETALSGTACGFGSDGAAYCWGRNWEGKLGDGQSTGANPTPTKVPLPSGVTGFKAISMGELGTYGIAR